MRTAAIAATLLFAFAACSTTDTSKVSPYTQPNGLMSEEIQSRIAQIPFQHREELLENLMWLAQTGEQTIPALLEGLGHSDAKTRSSCAWVLGRIRDRRTIPDLRRVMRDSEEGVRLEVARSLVVMGDLQQAPALIAGLDSDRKEVRFMCHEALKGATGHDFGYDHLNQDQQQLRISVLQWRQWWSDYSGDANFSSSYESQYGLGTQLAAPAGETQPMQPQPAPQQDLPNPDNGQAQDQPEQSGESQESEMPQQNQAEGGEAATQPIPMPVVVPPAVVPQGKPDGR